VFFSVPPKASNCVRGRQRERRINGRRVVKRAGRIDKGLNERKNV
jgi:hypothetical protein